MIAGGCIISGARVQESMLFYGAVVEERSHVARCVLLPYVRIGKDCRVRNAIIDEGCELPDGTTVGESQEDDRARFTVTDNGVVLVTPEMIAGLGAEEAVQARSPGMR